MTDIDFRSRDLTEKRLSNLDPCEFDFLGYQCQSIEGVLQSLKFKDLATQIKIIQMSGFEAKRAGRNVPWQTLNFCGLEIDRFGEFYQAFLSDLYFTMFEQNQSKLLLLLSSSNLDHSIGHNNKDKTILTKTEFIFHLNDVKLHFSKQQGFISYVS